MSDALRNGVVVAIAALRAGTEFAPMSDEIDNGYIDVWTAACSTAKLGPQDVVMAAKTYMARGHTTYPAVGRIVKVALEECEHRAMLAQANRVIRDCKALPAGEVTAEMREAARARLGITNLDIKRYKHQLDKDRGNVGGELSKGIGSLVVAAKQEASRQEASE